MCTRACGVCVCSESMNDVIDNGKNNFGDPWTHVYPCAHGRPQGGGGHLPPLDLEQERINVYIYFFFLALPKNIYFFFLAPPCKKILRTPRLC